jgi:septum formation protein
MSLWLAARPLVLASKSLVRRNLLESAGIPITPEVAAIDERAIEAAAKPSSPAEAAALLAREKARTVAAIMPGHLVLGADQTLALGKHRFSKPTGADDARNQLRALSGKTHELHSALALFRGTELLFECVDVARLTMRPLSDAFISQYLDAAGSAINASVGGYQVESLGIHLFERIEGDHFTILGLPLMPVLQFLRREGFLAG